ncbi:MAG: hypothetical protein DSY76_05795, partial [Bacteroidetes bacterium]
MSKQQLLILDDLGIDKQQFQSIANEKDIDYDLIWQLGEENTNSIMGIICVKTQIDQQLIRRYKNLKFIAVAFTGYNNVDLQSCRQNNIAVFNVPDYSTDSVAELTLGLGLSLLREIPKTQQKLRSGKW